MPKVDSTKTEQLNALAEQVNKHHKEGEVTRRKSVEHYRLAGEALIEAKKKLQTGEWMTWLKAYCPDVSERQAQRYMSLAKTDVTSDSDLELNWRQISGNAPKKTSSKRKTKTKPRRDADEPVTIPIPKQLQDEWKQLLRKAGEFLRTKNTTETLLAALRHVVEESPNAS